MLNINGIEVETDKDGYLLNSQQWNEDVAQAIAQLENIELTDAHWEVIYFVRGFYQEYNTSPAIRMLVKAMAKSLVRIKVTAAICNAYFLKVPQNKLQKLAGLPKPAKCL